MGLGFAPPLHAASPSGSFDADPAESSFVPSEQQAFGGRFLSQLVVDEAGGPLGTLFVHLHGDGDEYPLTTLIRSAFVSAGRKGKGCKGGTLSEEISAVLLFIHFLLTSTPLSNAGWSLGTVTCGGCRANAALTTRAPMRPLASNHMLLKMKKTGSSLLGITVAFR